ncbi:hypothetical protein [Tuwongella immobilis]|uniref:Uncharacterized protein n=1 Tax=Tuwongella immobilis TaxID=692036 RepID=A0A6C2YKF6_9BACT|nr:hypothetical protein [Tuwongella immobilis]VIP02058.1 unnamed protein product [Tuwongella immobilis]VTS00261.1 unnamed protein product [Tuwongella immobilis]
MMPDLRRLMQWLMVLAVLVGGLGVGTLRADSVVQPAPMSLESGVSNSVPSQVTEQELQAILEKLDTAEEERNDWTRGILLPWDRSAHGRAWKAYREQLLKLRNQYYFDKRLRKVLDQMRTTAATIEALYISGGSPNVTVVVTTAGGVVSMEETDRERAIVLQIQELGRLREQVLPQPPSNR